MYRKNIFDVPVLSGAINADAAWSLEKIPDYDRHLLRITGDTPTKLYHNGVLVDSDLKIYELLKGEDYELKDEAGLVVSVLGTRVTHSGAESVKWRK